MWWSSGADTDGTGGESSKEPPPNQEDMKERYEQQQILLAQLKEMLKKSEQSSSVSREKVEEYASTLSEINARTKLSKIKRSEGRKHEPDDPNKTVVTSKKSLVVTPAKEKINLLQQQLAENRAKLAQRDKNQKDIEEMFNQLKAQLDSQEIQEESPAATPPNLTIESTKEDLLTAIKCKDDHITELTAKMQQLQANVLDLQENIKEKDSVIDARTKAITLLSENLSKKGKNTLDMLDETKEQMRHMQENFIQLETNMKEENNRLQSDLFNKEKFIEELQETNNNLEINNKELQSRLNHVTVDLEKYQSDLLETENKLKELLKMNEDLQSKGNSEPSTPQKSGKRATKGKNKKANTPDATEDPQDKEEIIKLNKQLEEMNKTMIKMKAQHKAKLKEIQKKSTPNEQTEKVSILEQRLAELEEEKGNLQLRLVDLESTKEITAASNELSSLRSELSNLMHLENAQVCSEMTSVQLEEQLDKEVSQKKELQDRYNEIVKENEKLLEKIDALNKEKHELSTKLDSYMQENIELIDRLEKLSAEKVSSAESIEIVESLTQQEKLEIEAYQREHMEFGGTDKQSPDGDNHHALQQLQQQQQQQQQETKQQTEETSPSELLERIELFTVERREVMDKMDHLQIEKQQLLSKCENLTIEKDSLVARIEQLSTDNHALEEKLKNFEENNDNEKEYRALLENQKLQIASLQEELWNKPDVVDDDDDDTPNNSDLIETNQKLQETNASLEIQIENVQGNLQKATVKLNELQNKIIENEEEMNFLQTNLEDNKTELIKAAEKIAEYNKTIEMKTIETDELQQTILELNTELEKQENNKQEEIHIYSSQLTEFKAILSEHIDHMKNYENEIKQNTITIEQLNNQIEDLNYKITEYQHENQLKSAEIVTLTAEKSSYASKIENMEKEFHEKNETFTKSCRQLKEKCKFLENQIQTNTGSIEDIKIPFETRIKELETKNKEQVEKMKKIAANLKKKSAICQELEEKLAGVTEKWENETKEKDAKQMVINEQLVKLEENEVKMNSLLGQIQDFEKQKDYFAMEIERTLKEKGDVEMELQELIEINVIKSEAAASSEEVIQRLSAQLEDMTLRMETAQNAMEAKLQEKDMFIEHLEMESNKFREKVVKLEEGLSTIVERRQMLEEHAFDLKIQLEEKSFACEEAFQSEDFLEKRLSSLMEHDEIIEQKLKQSTIENHSLNNQLKTITDENNHLNHKLIELHSLLQESSENKEKLEQYEFECSKLTNNLLTMESDMRKLQNDYERKLSDKNIEIENMETELNAQLQELHAERKNILNRCEVLQDNIKEYADNEQLLNDEINQLQQKLETEKHLQFTESQHQIIPQIPEDECLQQQQQQQQPELKLELELERLQNIITQKDLDIENYQRQNMQLQMAASFSSTATIFDSPEIVQKTSLELQIDELTKQCNQKEIELNQLQQQFNRIQNEFEQSIEKYNQIHELYLTAQQEIHVQKTVINNLQEELFVRKTAEENVSQIISAAEETISEEMVQKSTGAYFQDSHTNLFDINLPSIESQIVSSKDDEQNPLIKPEFPPVNVEIFNEDVVDKTQSPLIVEEEVIQPKKAYLCYGDQDPGQKKFPDEAWGWATEDQKIRESVESQIVSMEDMNISPEEKKVFQQWEYGKVHSPKDSTDETIEKPKAAYLCYPEPSKNVDTFASEEDGWGWNAEEAKLEAVHRQSLGLTIAPEMDHGKIEQLEERIHDLEVERSRLLEEVKTHQIRSGKLIKKLKQMKENYDKLVDKSKTDDFGLDMAIQDELNNQIKCLEKKLKETTDENSKDKIEIEHFKQRLDVLQSANERMIELKEKTDNDIQFLQFKNRELTSKLEQFEWGDDSPKKCIQEDDQSMKEKSDESNKKIQELNATIQELTLDNEEMQLILEEQRRMRLEAEKALSNIPIPDNMKSEQLENEIAQLKELNKIADGKISAFLLENEELNAKSKHLQLNIENLVQENNMMNQQAQLKIEQLQNEFIELQHQLHMKNEENEYLKRQEIDTKQTELLQLNEELLIVQQEKQNLETAFLEKQVTMGNVQLELETIKNEKQTLQMELGEKEISIQDLNNRIQQYETDKNVIEQRAQEEKQILEIELSEKEIAIQHLNNRIEQLEVEKSILDQRIQEIYNIQKTDKSNDEKLREMNEQLMSSLQELESKNKELIELNNTLSVEKLETEQKMCSTIDELAANWSERVDQRGNDVAESWKLHLETVENEFTQRESKLKMELNEILTKNEEIIYQNNELQKQVDLIITEKQTCISDSNEMIQNLQQNLNSKQNEIYEISGKLQDLNFELESKNNEIKMLQDAFELMKTKDIEFEENKTELQIKNDTIKDLEEKLNDLNILSRDEQNQISDLRNIIENQVLKIEELKAEIEEKNHEYNILVAEFDNFEQIYLKGEKPDASLMENVENFATEDQILNPEHEQTKVEIDTAHAPVNRAELDLALYMLHQRDVRCEELTVELMQLLEERDTLQLKLSNAIRVNEELRMNSTENVVVKKMEKATGAIPKSKAIVLGATGTELATEATENISMGAGESRNNLNKKLSELKSIGYRDKTLKEDQEFRHIQQLSLMQQHRDLAAKLPAEAAARLVDANYTLSRDVQSPSKVLLNWLWGRSTPKVNDV